MQRRHILAYDLFFLGFVLFITENNMAAKVHFPYWKTCMLRRSAKQITPTSGVFRAAFWRVQSLAWRKAETF